MLPETNFGAEDGPPESAPRPERYRSQPATPEWRIDVLDSPEELFEREADLRALAAESLEPNIFHEPFMLFPALRAFGKDLPFRFVLVYGTPGGNPKPPMTARIFLPLIRVRRHRGLPVAALKNWSHIHCFLGTPLVSRREPEDSCEVLFDWLRDDDRAAPVLEWPLAGIDDLVFQQLADQCRRRDLPIWLADIGTRAICRPQTDAFHYIRNAMGGKAHKDFMRKQRRLAEQGKFEIRAFGTDGAVDRWCDDFLGLEASGWKGESGSALGMSAEAREFFRSILASAASDGRLMMLGFYLDDHPVAMKCNFLARSGSFAFKIAYDEKFAAFSPGQLLELENVRVMCEDKPAGWMDSCADPDHPMINRIWTERRTLATLHIATGKRLGHLAVSSLGALKWLQKKFVGKPPVKA